MCDVSYLLVDVKMNYDPTLVLILFSYPYNSLSEVYKLAS